MCYTGVNKGFHRRNEKNMNYLNWILLVVNICCGIVALVLHLNHASFATTLSIVLCLGMSFKIGELLGLPIKFDRFES